MHNEKVFMQIWPSDHLTFAFAFFYLCLSVLCCSTAFLVPSYINLFIFVSSFSNWVSYFLAVPFPHFHFFCQFPSSFFSTASFSSQTQSDLMWVHYQSNSLFGVQCIAQRAPNIHLNTSIHTLRQPTNQPHMVHQNSWFTVEKNCWNSTTREQITQPETIGKTSELSRMQQKVSHKLSLPFSVWTHGGRFYSLRASDS